MIIATTKEGINRDQHITAQCYLCPFCSMDFHLIGTIDKMGQHTDFLAKSLGIEVSANCLRLCVLLYWLLLRY